MGYYDDLHKSVYDSVYKRNFARDSAWKMAQRAANIAVYDAQQRDVRAAESGSGRLSTVYKALMAGQTVTPYKPQEKKVDQTVGESIGSIYRAAGINADVNKYREEGVGGWLTQNISGMTKAQQRKLANISMVLQAGGQVTTGGKVLKGSDAARLLGAYGELPSDSRIPAGVTPYMTTVGGETSIDFYKDGVPMDWNRQEKYIGAAIAPKYQKKYQVGEGGQITDKITAGEKYDVVRNTMKDGPKAFVVPHHQTVKYTTPEGAVKTTSVPQMNASELTQFRLLMVKEGNKILSIGDPRSLGEAQLKTMMAGGQTWDQRHLIGSQTKESPAIIKEHTIVTQNLESGREVPQLITDYKVLMDKMGMTEEKAKKTVSNQVKKYKAEAAVFGVTLTKPGSTTKVPTLTGDTYDVSTPEKKFDIPFPIGDKATETYQGEGWTVSKSGGSIINFGDGNVVGLQGVELSKDAQDYYRKMGVGTQIVTKDGQTKAGAGVRRKSANPYGGKSAIGTAWGAHKASVLSSARGIVDDENKWMAEQEKRAAEWDEYYAWVENQEKLYEAQKKAEEKAEKEYQEALTKFKKEQNKEGIEAWASATPYRRDRVQKPRRRAKQNIIQDAQASMNWGKLSNPFESTSGGVLSPYQRQSRRRVISKARGRQILPQGSMFRTSVMGDKPLAKRIRKGPKATKRVTRVDYFSPAYALAGFYMPRQMGKGGKKQ